MAAATPAWHHEVHALVCDVIEPWEHGTVVRATRCPSYHDFNVVRVEEDPGMSVEELIAFADRALAGLRHRRVDLESANAGKDLRPGFDAAGWLTERLVWVRHEGATPPAPRIAVEPVGHEESTRCEWPGITRTPGRRPQRLPGAGRRGGVLSTEVLAAVALR